VWISYMPLSPGRSRASKDKSFSLGFLVMSAATATKQQVENVLKSFDAHMETVAPGMPACFTEACVPGDWIAQGDLVIEMVEKIPSGYTENPPAKLQQPKNQLVPGNTVGSRHALNTLEGVELFYPKNFGQEDCLDGPVARVTGGQVVEHPKHGNVTLVGGIFSFSYQREYDAEQKRERRARD